MKARIFSSFAVLAVAALMSCQGTSTDNNNSDSTGAINAAPDTSVAQGDQNMNNNNATTTVDENTQTFMTKAAGGGLMEVELGQLAQQNAKSERVKNFGQMMVRDHSQANDDLKAVARQKNVTLPETMPAEHQHHKDDLSKKTGAEFDKAYMKMMVDDHKKDIDAFEKASKDASDPDVKNFASQKLPTLRMHLDSAKAINKDLK
jgi:putative membrane protein